MIHIFWVSGAIFELDCHNAIFVFDRKRRMSLGSQTVFSQGHSYFAYAVLYLLVSSSYHKFIKKCENLNFDKKSKNVNFSGRGRRARGCNDTSCVACYKTASCRKCWVSLVGSYKARRYVPHNQLY